jgi:hypothetical protein
MNATITPPRQKPPATHGGWQYDHNKSFHKKADRPITMENTVAFGFKLAFGMTSFYAPLIILACLVAGVLHAQEPLTSTQQLMIDCNNKAHGMHGDERKAFMSSCLKAGHAIPPAPAAEAAAAPAPATPAPKPKTAKADPSRPVGPSDWHYESLSDAMTSKDVYLAEVQSTNTVNFGFPYAGAQKMTLRLRTGNGRIQAAAQLTIGRGQFQCSVYSCPVVLRADDKPAITLTGAESADHDSTILFLPYKRVLDLISGAKKLAIAPTFFQNGSPVLTFQVENFDVSKMKAPPKGK